MIRRHFHLPLFLLLLLGVQGHELVIDDPGDGVTVHLFERVPNILRFPEEYDPYLKIVSDVPVSILLYNDTRYLMGGQPIMPEDVYVIIKSNCSEEDSFSPVLEYKQYQRKVEWDENNYTKSIIIETMPSNETTVLSYSTLPHTSFMAYFSYTSGWCMATHPDTASRVKTVSVLLYTLLLATAGIAISGTLGSPTGQRSSVRMYGVIMIGMVVAMVAVTGHSEPFTNNNNNSNKLQSQQQRQGASTKDSSSSFSRSLVEQTCNIVAEVIIDACRRSALTNKTDWELVAPAISIQSVDLKELSTTSKGCTTDHVAHLSFDKFQVGGFTGEYSETGTFLGQSLEELFGDSLQCVRAVEGRPFVDASGTQLLAGIAMTGSIQQHSLEEETNLWSSNLNNGSREGVEQVDEVLGREWAQRALGEHASVPAFAAFVIALMSNNAPPSLVQDAIQAAADEVHHAKRSFEIASMLLGTTIEPGPIPPSSLSFGNDLVALASSTAKEGCLEETLSALFAAYEVDIRIDQQIERLGPSTRTMLKESVRHISLEESQHSALAWRTVRWACKHNSDACTVVAREAFTPFSLEQAFEKRFGNHHEYDKGTKDAWDLIQQILIPYVMSEQSKAATNETIERNLNAGSGDDSFVTLVAKRIIQQVLDQKD